MRRSTVSPWRLIVVASCYLLLGFGPDGFAEPPQYAQPDRSKIVAARAAFERLAHPFEVSYSWVEKPRLPGGNLGRFGGPAATSLVIDIQGEAGEFLARHNASKAWDPHLVFALWPYLKTERDREAYVLSLAHIGRPNGLSRGVDFISGSIPFTDSFDSTKWTSNRAECFEQLAVRYRVLLSVGPKISRGIPAYDFNDLAKETLDAGLPAAATPSDVPREKDRKVNPPPAAGDSLQPAPDPVRTGGVVEALRTDTNAPGASRVASEPDVPDLDPEEPPSIPWPIAVLCVAFGPSVLVLLLARRRRFRRRPK